MEFTGLEIDHSSDTAVYQQIADAIRAAVRDGRLRSGDRLPATRDLARRLGVNRNTVVAAYELLASDGAVECHTGRGTFVLPAAVDPDVAGEAPVDPWSASFSRAVDGPGVERLLTVYRSVLSTEGISFAGSYPDASLMPADAFRRSLSAALRDPQDRLLSYGPTAGLPGLREALAEAMTARGGAVTADHLLITNGAQQGLELTFRTLLDPGDCAVVEDPTYTGALSVLGSIGARVLGLPSDEHGLLPDTLDVAMERHRPRLLYVQPTFHNPTTRTMPRERRLEILEIARRHRCPIVEDDWAADLAFDGEDPPTLHALDGGRHVIYLSTFSKKLMPGLRIGWAAAPPEVLRRLVALKQISDCGTSPVLQGGLLRFLEQGHLASHLRSTRVAYRERCDSMVAALASNLPEGARWTTPDGGMFVWVTLPEGFDGNDLFAAARRDGVLFSRGSLFHLDGSGAHTLRLTFASTPPDRIREGVGILGKLIRRRWPGGDRPPTATEMETVPVM